VSIEPYRGAGPVLGEDGSPLDQIQLLGLSATGYHGVFEHERRDGQLFVADVVVHLDLRPAAAGDDPGATVNYGALAEEVVAVLAGEPAELVETVAERVAAAVLRHDRVVAVDVAIHKPHAPVTVPMDDVVVAIRRDRSRPPVAALPETGAGAASPVDTLAPGGAFVAPDDSVDAAVPPVPMLVDDGTAPSAADAGASDGAVEHVPDALDLAPLAPVEAVLAFGSNLGAPADTLRLAITEVGDIPGVEVSRISPLARTAPVGGLEQPDYLNAVVIIRTTLAPRALLRACQQVEARHGRTREVHWGPRSLDIDLIVFGDVLAIADDLELPHPQTSQRAFVLEPWSQVAPDAVLPGLGGGPVAALAATAPDRDGIRWMAVDWLPRAEPASVSPFAPLVAAAPPPLPSFPPLPPPAATPPVVPPAASSGGDGTVDPAPITYLP